MGKKKSNLLWPKRYARWNEIYHHFLATLTNPSTFTAYRYVLQAFFAFIKQKYGAPRTPDRVTQQDIEAFLLLPVAQSRGAKLAGRPLAPYSRNAYLTAIKNFYKYCATVEIERRGKMVPLMNRESPAAHIKTARIDDVDRDMTEDEVRAFFAAIDTETLIGKRDFALFWALLITGRRRAEIVNLRRGDLDYGLFQSEDGATRKGWRFSFKGKWRTARESAEMDLSIIEALANFHASAGRDFVTMPAEQALFPGVAGPARGDQPMVLTEADYRFRKYRDAAGIAPNVVLHSLRWENAWQRYCQNGRDLIKTQEEMGWRNINQAAHYIRRRRQKLAGDSTARKIAAKFASTNL